MSSQFLGFFRIFRLFAIYDFYNFSIFKIFTTFTIFRFFQFLRLSFSKFSIFRFSSSVLFIFNFRETNETLNEENVEGKLANKLSAEWRKSEVLKGYHF